MGSHITSAERIQSLARSHCRVHVEVDGEGSLAKHSALLSWKKLLEITQHSNDTSQTVLRKQMLLYIVRNP